METNKNNNMELIIQTALNLLDLPIRKKDIDMLGIVHHPFISSIVIPYKNEIIDISKDKNKFKEYKKNLKETIRKKDDVFTIVYHINRPYRILFLSLIKNYLDKENFANLLKFCYVDTEFPNRDVNVPVSKIKDMFREVDKNLLMEDDEKEIFKNLDDELTIYRGFYSNEYYDALSWTLDIDKAHFFATRFSNNTGSIYQANIKKEDIYAYFDCRNEKEIIVDYNKLYNITKKEQFS